MEINTFWNKITLRKHELDDSYQLNVTNNIFPYRSEFKSPTIYYSDQEWIRMYICSITGLFICFLPAMVGYYISLVLIPIVIIILVNVYIGCDQYTIICENSVKIRSHLMNVEEFENICGFDQFRNPVLIINKPLSTIRIYKCKSKFMLVKKNKITQHTEKVISPIFSYKIICRYFVQIKCGNVRIYGLAFYDLGLPKMVRKEELIQI